MPSKPPPLWTCPKCGERFTGRNMSHSCSDLNGEVVRWLKEAYEVGQQLHLRSRKAAR